jgi:hypothetical protein
VQRRQQRNLTCSCAPLNTTLVNVTLDKRARVMSFAPLRSKSSITQRCGSVKSLSCSERKWRENEQREGAPAAQRR